MGQDRKNLLRGELIRKLLHISGVLCVPLASYNTSFTIFLLYMAVIFYIGLELLRLNSKGMRFTRAVLILVSRDKEDKGIVLGPITLAMGVIFVLVLFPLFPAQLGIIALTVGDGAASLIGRLWGRVRPAFLMGKSLEGSLACFLAVFISFLIMGLSWPSACVLALVASCVEVLPLGNFDNIFIPVVVSGCAFARGVLPYIYHYLIG